MAACDLSIELDEPDRVYLGGDKVEGTVHVTVDSAVKCSGLVLSTVWKTHGRGNVAGDQVQDTTVFSGQWAGGMKYEYRFSLPAGDWPQTYHGEFLSIDHYVEAKAKIPWAFDPKTATPFRVHATQLPSGHESEVSEHHKKSRIPAFIVVVLVAIFVGPQMLRAGWVGATFFLLVVAVVFGYWFIRKFLPRYLLGTPYAYLDENTLAPGGELVGEFATTTRKTVALNAITVILRGTEVCISGSGSNKTTHRNVIFENSQTLQSQATLQAGNESRCSFVFRLPEDAAYSISLNENSLIWTVDVEVDIPRWPDWSKSLPIFVVPSDGQAARSGGERLEADVVSSANQSGQDAQNTAGFVGGDVSVKSAGQLTFAETVAQLWAVRGDREQVEMVVEAVKGISFNIEADVERRLLYAGDEDPHVFKDGYAVWARYPDPRLPMVLYVPHVLGDEFEQLGKRIWKGKGAVVGWDSLHSRLQIKLEAAL